MDVSRALLLPDIAEPGDKLLKNLALYWDEIVVPVNAGTGERLLFETKPVASEAYTRLRDEFNIVRELPQPVHIDEVLAPWKGHEEQPEGTTRVFAITTDEDGTPRFDRYMYVSEEILEKADRADSGEHDLPIATSGLIADVALVRLSKARAYAASKNLAPLAYSFVGHVGSLTTPPEPNLRLREAALISATTQLFELDATVSLEDIVRLRQKHKNELARLRAALGDLSESLQADNSVDHLMAQAHDVVRNRVEPAVGALESALTESRILFALKALFGASTLVAMPVAPTLLTAAGPLTVQSLKYRFSRDAMVREHPFGFLHRLNAFGRRGRRAGTATFRGADDPRRCIQAAVAAVLIANGTNGQASDERLEDDA